jgi:hypothetical protein
MKLREALDSKHCSILYSSFLKINVYSMLRNKEEIDIYDEMMDTFEKI